MSKDAPTSIESTNEAYQTRVDGLAASYADRTAEAEEARKESGIVSVEAPLSESAEFQAVAADDDEVTTEEDGEPTPDMSWKKDAIVDYIVESGVEVERDELEKMNKADLLERFTDYDG